ncbi:MAG: hypothetical protein CM15mP103_05250 [Gammaproteobacteria bacterium]|nr:MAG: hypothetical protein CM15mP103_05250 [Gammaproteobacteria bacterium]
MSGSGESLESSTVLASLSGILPMVQAKDQIAGLKARQSIQRLVQRKVHEWPGPLQDGFKVVCLSPPASLGSRPPKKNGCGPASALPGFGGRSRPRPNQNLPEWDALWVAFLRRPDG